MRYVNLGCAVLMMALFVATDPTSSLAALLAIGGVLNIAAYLAQTPLTDP